ncbi:MAG: FAD-dependent oxidoreductase, partial [bacterium]|nr:FAD-dependent oxidoreductase [bacterium]
GSFFLDATELGDLLPMTRTEYVTGAESQKQTGELHAPAEPDPANMQAITWCFIVDYVPKLDSTIDKPREYEFWRNYVPDLKPPWPGPQLSLTYSHPQTLEPRTATFDPRQDGSGHEGGFWAYRRLINKANFNSPWVRDICLVNWPQNDYWLGNIIDVSASEAARHRERARQLSLSLLYWLQTEARWPGLRPRGDLTGTADGLAKRPYIRESRRIKAEFTVLEEHVGAEQRMEITGL